MCLPLFTSSLNERVIDIRSFEVNTASKARHEEAEDSHAKSVLVAILALIPMSYARAQIPAAEREALIALYNSTGGATWLDNTGWLGAVGTECTWYEVTCALGHVTQLNLYSNQLSGSVPAELGNLSALEDAGGISLSWNALHSNNATLITFLNSRHWGGDWQGTQTIAPVNLSVDSVGDHTVWLSWDAVSYQITSGGYEVFSAPTGTGVWTTGGWTEAKTDTTHPVTGLDPATSYDLAVVTFTDPHLYNLNLVHSDFSLQEMATTAAGGCAEPTIEKAGSDPITLSVSGSYDSYLWSRGDTTSSIVVNPQLWKWYWVTVTSAGSCEETAATWVGPETPVFADGFESGNTSEWSSKVP